ETLLSTSKPHQCEDIQSRFNASVPIAGRVLKLRDPHQLSPITLPNNYGDLNVFRNI
ncbi:hypothetical protein NPIL_503281, partial [Nephila pilipes]